MNQSIYTERENILPHHAEWLDGCGATWNGLNKKFSEHRRTGYDSILFTENHFQFWDSIDGGGYKGHTHIPTGTEFCERVAEILGLSKPTFEVDISKTETTTDHIPYVGEKADDHDKLFPGRNNTMGEGSLTQEDIEILLGDSIVKSIKGMAIEVSRLSEEDRGYLEALNPTNWNWNWKYCVCSEKEGKEFNFLNYYSNQLFKGNYTITESPIEFLEYVGKQTGKEYKKTADYDVQKFVANREGMAERLAKAPFTNEELMDLPDEEIGKLNFGKPTYPHKTYRILDSLDGIPLDTRIPLSEWIPPMGPKGLVAFISEGWFEKGYLLSIEETRVFIRYGEGKSASFEIKDGHWMRIV